MNFVIGQGWAMYWGTAKWSSVEIMEAYSNCRQFNCVTPILEQAEYHMFNREKAELYMAELYNKIGYPLIHHILFSSQWQKNFESNHTKVLYKKKKKVLLNPR